MSEQTKSREELMAAEWAESIGRQADAAPVTAYLCRGLQCLPAMRTLAELEPELARTEATTP